MSALQKLQQWYLQHCNNDWEHDFGIKIETLDNPGWSIKIDLQLTALQYVTLEISEEKSELDWYYIKAKDSVFQAYCDATKLEFIITYFLEEFVPKFEDKDFEYEVLLPLKGLSAKVWLMGCMAKKIDEQTFKIISISNYDDQKTLTETFDVIENNHQDFDKLHLVDKLGDLIQTTLISTFQGIRLAKAHKINL